MNTLKEVPTGYIQISAEILRSYSLDLAGITGESLNEITNIIRESLSHKVGEGFILDESILPEYTYVNQVGVYLRVLKDNHYLIRIPPNVNADQCFFSTRFKKFNYWIKIREWQMMESSSSVFSLSFLKNDRDSEVIIEIANINAIL